MATQNRAPTSDVAVSGSWTGSAGSRWGLVDDYPDTAPADYLEHGTTAGYLTFGFAAFSVPAGSTGISVQVRYYDAEPANGNNNIAGRLTVGGTSYNAATHNPSGTSYTARSDNWANNPKSAAAWTVDDVNGVGANALQAFGLYSSDANPVMRASCVQLQVTYTPPQLRGQVSWAEVETPVGPRRGLLSFAELEGPEAPRRGLLSFAELEGPLGPRQAFLPFAEFEAPNITAVARGLLSWAEVRVPNVNEIDATIWHWSESSGR